MYYAGIDLGGTNIAAGIVDDDGKIIESMSIPTGAQRNFHEIVCDMAELVKNLCQKKQISIDEIRAVGIGCPGSIDSEKGVCEYSNNLNMCHADITGEFRKILDIPVYLENDANAAALGEYEINAKGSKSFVFVTLGTGVGGGVIINGEIFRGFNGVGAELGHTVINVDGEKCTCGRKGCWEAYASVTALIRQTKAAMEKHPESSMHKFAQEEGKISGLTSFLAAKEGDKYANQVVQKYFEYIAEGITNIINIFQPEKLAIGGSISKEGDYLLKPVSAMVERDDYNKYMPKAKIEIAKLFGDAGIIGAAIAAKNALNRD
ncbi:MAG: ROK family protein [Firmicutes bacterium]|nr:ROK family protein [Bacillota bacterium]